MALLEYENQIFLDSFQEDGLLVMAKGLGIERIFSAFLKIYCDPGNLVLVLNTSSVEEEYFIAQLGAAGVTPLPRNITSDCSTEDRKNIYLEGGVLFITTRILVVDMLVERIPIHLISGILVYRAHKVIDSCQEAFILRLYRQKNKTGFIKAFSDNAMAFTAGFCHVERVMKSLFVRKLYLWPRFQASVVALLDMHKIDVVELHLQLTESMRHCQTALLDLIDSCIKELKRGNRLLDTEEITVEYAVSKKFDKVVHMIVDPIWHQLSSKTKQLIADLKTLRELLHRLTEYDCINFYNLVNSIRSSEKVFGSNSGWLFTDAAENLFVSAKKRLYKPADGKAKRAKTDSASSRPNVELELQFEECPKWLAIKDVLSEIKEHCETSPTDGDNECNYCTMIVSQDDRICTQIKEYLGTGGPAMMTKLYERVIVQKKAPATSQDSDQENEEQGAQPVGRTRLRNRATTSAKPKGPAKKNVSGRKAVSPKSVVTLTQMVGGSETKKLSSAEDSDTAAGMDVVADRQGGYKLKTTPPSVLHPLHGSNDPNGLVRTLNELMPTFVILYDADMAFVRQLEIFKASHPGHPLRVYFLMYKGSVEEQRYLTTLRTEKEAFEYLIRQKAVMVVPEEREGKVEDDPWLARDAAAPATAAVSTRKGGYQSATQQKIIVDMREFRSELPSLIHRRGIDIEPVTLEVGDYILTPDICVERKSISDLIGSLNTGRLYNQCVAMCRAYKRPVLLIEFDPSKPFTLQEKYPISGAISSNDAISRLTLLTMHFPRLRLLWCPSPYTTAELFDELKAGRDQPVVEDAAAVTSDAVDNRYTGMYNGAPQDMLLKMPGMNSKNVYSLMNRVENLKQLVSLGLDELTEILSSSANAKLLHDFIHSTDQLPQQTDTTASHHGKVAAVTGKSKLKLKSAVQRKASKKK